MYEQQATIGIPGLTRKTVQNYHFSFFRHNVFSSAQEMSQPKIVDSNKLLARVCEDNFENLLVKLDELFSIIELINEITVNNIKHFYFLILKDQIIQFESANQIVPLFSVRLHLLKKIGFFLV